MPTSDLILATVSWAVASAIGVILLGVLSVLGGKSRPRGAFAFGIFSVVWGTQILIGNVAGIVGSPATAQTLYLIYFGLLVALPYFLVEFSLAHTASARARGGPQLLRFAAAGLGLLSGALFLSAPGLFFLGVQGSSGVYAPQWGVLYVPLVQVPLTLAFGLALVALYRARQVSPTPRTAERSGILLAGLGIYVGFAASNNLVFYAASIISYEEVTPSTVTLAAVFGVLTVLALIVGLRSLERARKARAIAEMRVDRLVALALLVPIPLGAIEALLSVQALPFLQTVGLWRLIGVGIIAYGIARWRIYDLPQRASRVAASASGATAAVATGAAAYGAASVASSAPAVPVVAGLVVLAAMFVPSMRFARRFFRVDAREPQRNLEQALYGQRIDAYRAALEASLARNSLEEDREFLAALRERFGITDAEERVLMHYARSSVVVARDRHAWDAYERLRLLGEGGGGRTWLARDRQRDRLVVLKEPLERWQQEPAAREAVLREARLAAKVRHPNVVAVEEVVAGHGSPIIVMEYLEGGSLSDLLRARGTLPWAEAQAIMLDILRGLEAVHASGIVHRDVKPSNVLLTGEGVAKIADFGIAVAAQQAPEARAASARTQILDSTSSSLAGTFLYMAPECRAGQALPDRRADIYSCGAVLHECLYGAPPGVNVPVVVRSDVPAGVAAVLARALAERPEARHASARALAEDIARIQV